MGGTIKCILFYCSFSDAVQESLLWQLGTGDKALCLQFNVVCKKLCTGLNNVCVFGIL